jgi:mRNA interferase YafO
LNYKVTVDVYNELDKVVYGLAKDFKLYKQGYSFSVFGKDGAYIRPDDIQPHELCHVHLMTRKDTNYLNSYQDSRTSDRALVYARGIKSRNSYLLIAVLEPPAHDKAQDYEFMRFLAAIAAEFRRLN